jgi:polyisoprenoid-binding protein YceI
LSAKAQTKWSIDQAHSSIQFEVDHMVVSSVTGSFKKFSGFVTEVNDSFEGGYMVAEIDAESIDTGNAQRDNHLKAPDFFNITKYPTIKFESTSIKRIDERNYRIEGNLTMCGVTNPLVLTAQYGGQVTSRGGTKAGFKGKGVLSRFDYGLRWNNLMETGGAMVGETVEFRLNIELSRA